jgi:cold shock CspA family protein
MLRGIVKWFNERKGLGVIVAAEDHTTDVVVLSPSIATRPGSGQAEPARVLKQGETVAYEIDPDRPNLVRLVIVTE